MSLHMVRESPSGGNLWKLTSAAGLTKTKAVPYALEGPYSLAKDREEADRHWANIDIDAGVIALSDSYVSEKGLPEAMRFPWDDTKGIYFIDAYHNLHCLVSSTLTLTHHSANTHQMPEKSLPRP